MAILLFVILAYLAAVAQPTLVPLLRVGDAAPDLLALLAVVWALRTRSRYGFLGAGAIALAGDLISPGRIGLGAGWMLLVAFGLVWFQTRRRLCHPALQTAVVLVAVTLWAGALGLSCRAFGQVDTEIVVLLRGALATGVYTAGVALPVLMVLGWWNERNGPARLESPRPSGPFKPLGTET